jgi:DNA-binding NtrC family response regulator
MDTPTQVLVASSELENRRALAAILQEEGYDTICVSRASECKEALETHDVSLVFCDRRLSDGNYRDVLAATRLAKKKVRTIVTSRLADWDEYLEALHQGAFDLIVSPCHPTDVLWALIQARRESQQDADFVSPGKVRSGSASQLTA